MPFRFGAVTLHEAELLTCRATIRDPQGGERVGWSADLLPPQWFRKDAAATPQQDADELFAAAVSAAQCYVAQGPGSAFAVWRGVLAELVDSQDRDQADLLVRGFGVAIVERALLDACCRLAGLPFAQALQADAFGFVPGAVHAQLSGWDWRGDLPEPRTHVAVRHTVGMLDVLRTADLGPQHRADDGLPQTLEEDLVAYGLSWFKVKIGAGVAQDRARLLDLAALFDGHRVAPQFTLDGNEQYEDLDQLAEVLETVAEHRIGRELLSRVALIEQPLARSDSFVAARHRALERVTRFAPLLIDEADSHPEAFARALELGYRGVSVKNCKGVFRALCNFGICKRGAGRFQSGEDLTNIGVLSLQQDLVTGAVLGLPHVERNGHHYFRGLDHLDGGLAERALVAHPDVYQRLTAAERADAVALRIQSGRIEIGSLLTAVGYGHSCGDYAQSLQVVATA
jgi:hypothetical protein